LLACEQNVYLVVFLFASMQAQRLFGRSEHVYLAVKASDAIEAAARLLTGPQPN